MSLAPYIKRFAIYYFFAVIVIATLFYVLDLDSSFAGTIASLVAGVHGSASLFIKNNQRVPTIKEHLLLSVYSLISTLVVSLILVVVVALVFGELAAVSQFVASQNVAMVAIVLSVVCLLQFVVLMLFYYTFSKSLLKSLKNDQ